MKRGRGLELSSPSRCYQGPYASSPYASIRPTYRAGRRPRASSLERSLGGPASSDGARDSPSRGYPTGRRRKPTKRPVRGVGLSDSSGEYQLGDKGAGSEPNAERYQMGSDCGVKRVRGCRLCIPERSERHRERRRQSARSHAGRRIRPTKTPGPPSELGRPKFCPLARIRVVGSTAGVDIVARSARNDLESRS